MNHAQHLRLIDATRVLAALGTPGWAMDSAIAAVLASRTALPLAAARVAEACKQLPPPVTPPRQRKAPSRGSDWDKLMALTRDLQSRRMGVEE